MLSIMDCSIFNNNAICLEFVRNRLYLRSVNIAACTIAFLQLVSSSFSCCRLLFVMLSLYKYYRHLSRGLATNSEKNSKIPVFNIRHNGHIGRDPNRHHHKNPASRTQTVGRHHQSHAVEQAFVTGVKSIFFHFFPLV